MRPGLLILLMAAVLIRCGSKEKDPEPELSIVGKWEVAAAKVKLLVNDKPLKEYLIGTGMSEAEAEQAVSVTAGPVDPADIFIGIVYEFKADGTVSVTSDGGSDQGTWTLSDDKKNLTIKYDVDPPGVDSDPNLVNTLTATDLIVDLDLGSVYNQGYPVAYFITLTFKRK